MRTRCSHDCYITVHGYWTKWPRAWILKVEVCASNSIFASQMYSVGLLGRKYVEVTKSSSSTLNGLQLTIPGSVPLSRSTSTPHGFYQKPSSVSCQVSLKHTQILFLETSYPTEMETHSLKWLWCFSCDPKQLLPFSNTDRQFCIKVGNSSRTSKRDKLPFIQAHKTTLTWMNENSLVDVTAMRRK